MKALLAPFFFDAIAPSEVLAAESGGSIWVTLLVGVLAVMAIAAIVLIVYTLSKRKK
ncbi:MAG: hypothetical protein AB7V55_08575 [Oscillospiraceae bacterium]